MSRPNAELKLKAKYIASLLKAIYIGSGYNSLGAMCEILASRIPKVDPRNLHRNWNRWLVCAKTKNSYPDIDTLISIVFTAEKEGWLESSKRSIYLQKWLRKKGEQRKHHLWANSTEAIEEKIHSFVTQLFLTKSVIDADIEELAPAMMRAFGLEVAAQMDVRLNDFLAVSPILKAAAGAAANAFKDLIEEAEGREHQTMNKHNSDVFAQESDRRSRRFRSLLP